MSGKKNICNLELNVNVNKSAPVLSQSEYAFNSRYHTGKIARGGGKRDCCDTDSCCSEDLDCCKDNSCCDMSGGAYYLDVGSPRVGGLPEVVSVFDPLPPKYSPKGAGKYPQPSFMKPQKGGAYRFIVNPETGRRVKLDGRVGRRVLKNYLMHQNGGDMSIFDSNMQNREFGCKQPEWSPNCV